MSLIFVGAALLLMALARLCDGKGPEAGCYGVMLFFTGAVLLIMAFGAFLTEMFG